MGLTKELREIRDEGLETFRSIDVDETEEEVKATGGFLCWARIQNLHSSAYRYLKFYDGAAADVTVGTTTPKLTIPLKADSGEVWKPLAPIRFDNGICVAATTALADADTGGPGANEVVVNIGYA